jgi:hypothetical protein
MSMLRSLPSSDPIRRFRDIIDNIDAIVDSIAADHRRAFRLATRELDARYRHGRLRRTAELALQHGALAQTRMGSDPQGLTPFRRRASIAATLS